MTLYKDEHILLLHEIETPSFYLASDKPLPFLLVKEDEFKSSTRMYKSIVIDGKFYGIKKFIPIGELDLNNMAEKLAHEESIVNVPSPVEQFFHFDDVDIWKSGWAEGFKYVFK